MDKQVKARLAWVELYKETGDAGLTCRRCGFTTDPSALAATVRG